ncbi:MAG: hypothetical protein ABJZ55_18825 [Fuerstiella sp.]
MLLLAACASTGQVAAAEDDGAISLKSVLPARTLVPAKTAPSAVPPVPSSAKQDFVAPLNKVRSRSVLLTSAQDEAATIQIPELLPPPVPGLADSHVSSMMTGQLSQPSPACQCQKCRSKRSGHQVTRRGGLGQKFKAGAKRVLGCFIEVDECDEVHFDVDDYHMPILLVSAQGEETDKEESSMSDDEDPAVGLLSRKLTDIQPTLAYAYGEKDERVLPEAFYKKVDHGVYEQQVGPKMVLQWEPTNLWYYPLYFQDVGLERYGHTHKPWVQPFVSTGKFFGQVTTLPYRMVLDPPTCPQYSLGYYQPGEWAPKKKYQLPFNEEAAATQFLWMTGFFLIIP